MLHRGKPLPTRRFRPVGRGPLLGVGAQRVRRRRVGAGWRKSWIPIAIALIAASWVYVIGPDLRPQSERHFAGAASPAHAKASVGKHARSASAQRPAGPGHPNTPQLAPSPALPTTLRDRAPVSHALLSAARDHVARRVHAAWGSVPDLDAVKGADVDLVERGLHVAGFPLREALIRHRFREPRRYGLRRRPQATEANRKRALTTANLRVFLDRFAEQLPARWDGVSGDSYLGGDLVLVARQPKRGGGKRSRGRRMFAVVSDRTDANGVSLLFTLDPREGEARERHSLSRYDVLRHYRVSLTELSEIRETLRMRPRRPAARRGRLL